MPLVTLCCSGTAAVELALRGLGVAVGDEVVMAGYDFKSNFTNVNLLRATPVLVDVRTADFQLDVDQIRAAVTSRTKAVVASHLQGGVVDMFRLRKVADEIVSSAERGRAPHVDVPSRSLSNTRFNKSKRILEMGSASNRRELFNLSQAKAYMQTLLVGKGCKQLLDQAKTTSLRGLYYMLKHTIEGTREETFEAQNESDEIIEDVEVTLNALREELHVYASNRGNLVGPITLIDGIDEIDCTRMGSAGYSIPSIVEPEVIRFTQCSAKNRIFSEFGPRKRWWIKWRYGG